MTIYARLKEAREAAGLTQGQTAKKLDMHRPTISEIEAGRRKITTDEVEKFALLFGVSVSWLVNGPTADNDSDARIQIAARELSKMSEHDIERLMNTLRMFKKSES